MELAHILAVDEADAVVAEDSMEVVVAGTGMLLIQLHQDLSFCPCTSTTEPSWNFRLSEKIQVKSNITSCRVTHRVGPPLEARLMVVTYACFPYHERSRFETEIISFIFFLVSSRYASPRRPRHITCGSIS